VLNDDDTQFRQINALEQRRKVFTRNASKGDDIENKSGEIIDLVNAWIKAYVDEKNAHKSTKNNTLRTNVENGLDLTE